MRFTAIDFETANEQRNSICCVGIAVVENGVVVDQFKQFIRPNPLRFCAFNVSIHQIQPSTVESAPRFEEVWPSLWERVRGPLVAHNASFDMSVLRLALNDAKIAMPAIDYFCTVALSKLAWPGHLTYCLTQVAKSLGIKFQHHDAQEDARACALITIEACKALNVASIQALQGVKGFHVGHISEGTIRPCRVINEAKTIHPTSKKPNFSNIIPSGAVVDELNPCYGVSFAFTGEMSGMRRNDAVQLVVDRGGNYHNTVKSSTDYLVMGQEGFRSYEDGHQSAKMGKAEKLRAGGSCIEVVSEADFLKML